MGLRDVLFGKKKLAEPAAERLFALVTAAVTLETELNLRSAGVGAVCFKPLSAAEFERAQTDIGQLLEGVAAESGSKLERSEDSFGYQWIVVRDAELEDQVTAVHAVASGLEEQGFWPFVPKDEGHERDNATELELKAKLESELPIEQDLTRWFGVFGAPL